MAAYYQGLLLEHFQNIAQGKKWENFVEDVFDFLSARTTGRNFAGCPYAVMGTETALSRPDIASAFMDGVTCSHHLNLTDFEVGASCSIALQGKAKTGYPRVSRGSFLSGYRFFYVPLRTLFIYLFSFFEDIDSCIHIPIHPVSTFTYVCPF